MVAPGLLVVLACVIGGFCLAGGNPVTLWQPGEFLIILGIAFGALVVSTPLKLLKKCFAVLFGCFRRVHVTQEVYVELLAMMYQLFALARKNGLLALEPHLNEPGKSDIISKYPAVLRNKAAMELLVETFRLVVDGSVQAEDIEPLMDSSIETYESEGHMPVNVLRNIADGLPGLGIVGAVLGIIVTMTEMDKPERVGQNVAHALVGTLLGVFFAYGVLFPMVTTIAQHEAEQTKYLVVIKTAMSSYVSGASPSVAIEFARRSIFSFDRPPAVVVEKACKGAR